MKAMTCAVAGVGGVGVEHAAWMEKTGAMEVVALADVNPEALERARPKFPKARFHSDVATMLRQHQLDFVVVASPHFLHAPLAIQCLEAGVNVMVEKPMATTLEDCRKMIAAAENAGKFLTVFHNRRFDDWFVKIHQAVKAGALGPLIEMNVAVHNNPTWLAHGSWREQRKESGGLLFDWGAHLVDQLLHFDTSPVKSVSGFFYELPGASQLLNHDHGVLEIRFASGALGRLTLSSVAWSQCPRYYLIGREGTLQDEWNWNGGSASIYAGKEFNQKTSSVAYGAEIKDWSRFYMNIVDHFQGNKPLSVTPQSAARVIDVLESALISHEQGGIPIAPRSNYSRP